MKALDDILQLRVPNLYRLQLCLPSAIEHEETMSFYDCKLRRLIIVAPIAQPKVVELPMEEEEEIKVEREETIEKKEEP